MDWAESMSMIADDIDRRYEKEFAKLMGSKFSMRIEEETVDATPTLSELLEKGDENINSFRVMVIGCFAQGKTSLVRKLLGKPLGEPQSTNGIEIHSCKGDATGKEWEDKPPVAPEDDFVHRLVPVARTLPETKDPVKTDKSTCPGFITINGMHMSTGSYINNALVPLVSDAKTSHFQGIRRKLKKALKDDTNTNDSLTGINVWDFGGEFVFYATHQLFLCRQAVYLLVFRLDISLDDVIPDDEYPGSVKPHQRTMREYIEFWISSVHAFVGDVDGKLPTIILVGTHKDKLNNTYIAKEYFESIRSMFDERILRHHIYKKSFDVSSVDDCDPNIKKLRKAIMDIYEKQIKVCKVPIKWLPLEYDLGKRKEDVLLLEQVIELDKRSDYPPIGHQQVPDFLQHHHDTGTVYFVPDGTMPDGTPAPYVILNPQFIADAFKCVVTAQKFYSSEPKLRELWKKLSVKAILDPKLLDSVWTGPRFGKHKHRLRECLVKLMVMGRALRFEANGKFTPLDYFIVPSLLRSHSKDEVHNFLENKPRTSVSILYEFTEEAILPSIYQRFTAAAIGTWPILKYKGKDMVFTNCSAYKLDYVHSGLIKQERNRLEILVVQLCTDEEVAKEVPDYFRRFFEYVLHDIISSREGLANFPVSKFFRCMHTMHGNKGTIESYSINTLDPMAKVSCPDHVSHPGIYIADVLETWFGIGIGNAPMESNIPKRRLNDKEIAKLSGAIGDNWQILGSCLGIDQVAIQHISRDCPTEPMRIFKMLQKWSSQNGDCATLDVLVKALYDNENIKYNRDVVRNVIDGFC